MVQQYPDILTYQLQEPGTFDSNGNPIAGGLGEVIELQCRAEAASGPGIIKTVDGEAINYSWIIYMPLGQVDNIPIGTQVTIGGKLKDTVKRFYSGQLNARIWL